MRRGRGGIALAIEDFAHFAAKRKGGVRFLKERSLFVGNPCRTIGCCVAAGVEDLEIGVRCLEAFNQVPPTLCGITTSVTTR